MRQAERDRIALEQADSVTRAADALRRVAEKPERDRRQEEADAGFPPPVNFLAGQRGLKTMAAAIPGFAALWPKVVPSTYLSIDGKGKQVVRCTCEATTTLAQFAPTECSGKCGRWFLELSADVRVHNFTPPEVEQPAAAAAA